MKNKKIISLVCALAMVFSMFSAFTVVNAADKGIKLEGSLSKDLTEVTIKATAENFVGGMTNAAISFDVPEGITESDISFTADSGFVIQVDGLDDRTYTLALLAIGTFVTPQAELATIKLKLPAPLADDLTITLGQKSGFQDSEGAISVANGMTATSVTIKKYNK